MKEKQKKGKNRRYRCPLARACGLPCGGRNRLRYWPRTEEETLSAKTRYSSGDGLIHRIRACVAAERTGQIWVLLWTPEVGCWQSASQFILNYSFISREVIFIYSPVCRPQNWVVSGYYQQCFWPWICVISLWLSGQNKLRLSLPEEPANHQFDTDGSHACTGSSSRSLSARRIDLILGI